MCSLSDSRLPRELETFLRLYKEGYFFDSHEVLEETWLHTRSSLYHGLIILAAAFCKRDRGNPNGVVRNLAKARQRLEGLDEVGSQFGLDIPAIVSAIDVRLQNLYDAGIDPSRAVAGDGRADPAWLKQLAPDLPLE